LVGWLIGWGLHGDGEEFKRGGRRLMLRLKTKSWLRRLVMRRRRRRWVCSS